MAVPVMDHAGFEYPDLCTKSCGCHGEMNAPSQWWDIPFGSSQGWQWNTSSISSSNGLAGQGSSLIVDGDPILEGKQCCFIQGNNNITGFFDTDGSSFFFRVFMRARPGLDTPRIAFWLNDGIHPPVYIDVLTDVHWELYVIGPYTLTPGRHRLDVFGLAGAGRWALIDGFGFSPQFYPDVRMVHSGSGGPLQNSRMVQHGSSGVRLVHHS